MTGLSARTRSWIRFPAEANQWFESLYLLLPSSIGRGVALELFLSCLLLFYAKATVISWQWYDVWDEKEKSWAYTFTNSRDLGHGMKGTGLWWCCKLCTVGKWIAAQLNVIAVTGIHTPVPRVTYSMSYLSLPPALGRTVLLFSSFLYRVYINSP